MYAEGPSSGFVRPLTEREVRFSTPISMGFHRYGEVSYATDRGSNEQHENVDRVVVVETSNGLVLACIDANPTANGFYPVSPSPARADIVAQVLREESGEFESYEEQVQWIQEASKTNLEKGPTLNGDVTGDPVSWAMVRVTENTAWVARSGSVRVLILRHTGRQIPSILLSTQDELVHNGEILGVSHEGYSQPGIYESVALEQGDTILIATNGITDQFPRREEILSATAREQSNSVLAQFIKPNEPLEKLVVRLGQDTYRGQNYPGSGRPDSRALLVYRHGVTGQPESPASG